jgi:hypothetical protein
MKDTTKEADLILAELMGYATPDYPKWSRKLFSKEEIQAENHKRYLERKGTISKSDLNRFMRELDTRSKANYEFLHPRRPEHWDKVLKAYLSLPVEKQDQINKEEVEKLIEYTSPEAMKERKHQEQLTKQAKKEARRVRNLRENKVQEWNWGEKQQWAHDEEDTSEEDKPRFIVKANKGGVFWKWYHGFFERFIGNIDHNIKTGKTGGAASITSSWSPERLAGGVDDEPVYNNPEFSTGYGFGYLPPPGKKKSGRTRYLLGEK